MFDGKNVLFKESYDDVDEDNRAQQTQENDTQADIARE